jgi:GT2 family glycosyltransferase
MPEIIPGLVSTIIPCYNRPQMLREAVESVLAQTYRNIEIIIVDDGSTDDAPTVARQFAVDHPDVVRFQQKENTGPGPTREAGRQLARGEFIQYLDSDDLLRPRKFELMVKALRDRPDCGAAYGWICVHKLNQPAGTTPYKGSGITRDTLFPWLLADRWWNTDCPLFRRSVTDKVGPWTNLRWSQDWEYDARVAALGTKLVHVQDWVCDERHHTTGRQTDFADWANDPVRLRSRKQFLQLMLQHAETAQIDEHSAERQHLTRWIFTTARNCAANGLVDEARDLMESAERSAGECRAVRSGFWVYKNIARLTGFRNAARILRLAENLRRPGQFTQSESFAR